MSWRRKALLAGAAAVAVLSVAIMAAYQRDLDTARSRLGGRSAVIESAYGRLEYAEEGSGVPLLMIHGSGGGFDQGLAFADRLPRSEFRVIAPSRFGYLRSDFPEDATPEMQADALAALLKHLGIEHAVIAGGSAGALSATQLALRHPELCRGLVLLVPAAYAPDRAPNTSAASSGFAQGAIQAALGSDFLFWLAARTAPDQMTRLLLATDAGLLRGAGKAERQRVRRVLMDVLPVSERKRGLLMDGATAGAPAPYAPEKLSCPVLAISAKDDLYGTDKAAKYAADKAPRSRLILYESGGHLWVGHDREVWAEVAAFARGLPQ
jgi:2-hydroxy-6-oxonona-2,4-dienedioate hydrolase